MTHKRILIIDDNADILAALKIILEQGGFEVRILESGKGALKELESFDPALVLLDVLISGENGGQICRTIKGSLFARVPVVMISAHPNAHNLSLEAGADDFIAKPFDLEVLLSKVRKYTA